ncbi:DUF2642 domain-containing protein [Maledivibacter halophilus]|uniref:DUF2642 domain-containing protein n=1 Tax=Maledivibacter halophilus TaxID=36842 RepID=A0A1T5LCE2_9FIRM|nr:DUF2642 domain-containing protein [Maledivibacter halophilus]SKC73706.1 Protein of unknown function [Maledivibacter halophilus]
MFNGYRFQQNNMQYPVQMISLIDPYVVETLESIIGKRVIVDTVRGVVQGNLIEVKPDHIVLKELEEDQPTFVRIQQIVFVMPIK